MESVEKVDFKRTNIAEAVSDLFEGELNDAEAINQEIESLRELLTPYHNQEIDAKTFAYIEGVAKRIEQLKLKLSVVDMLKIHHNFK